MYEPSERSSDIFFIFTISTQKYFYPFYTKKKLPHLQMVFGKIPMELLKKRWFFSTKYEKKQNGTKVINLEQK